MFKYNFCGKEVVFLCASRTYYHNKKKYYLDGNCYDSLECADFISDPDAVIIEETLRDKKYLSNLLDLSKSKRIAEIKQKHSIVNLIIDLTYGKGIRKKLKKKLEDVKHLSNQEMRLLLEVAVFDKADIEYYPVELFNERYGRAVELSEKIDIKNMKIVDFLRYDDRGLSLRNSMFQDELLKMNRDKIYTVLKELLMYISRYVYEGNNDVWVIIFQSLLKEKRLNEQFVFTEKEIGKLLYELKDNYEDISYYWLQLGIYEQQKKDYAKALSHLKMAQHIQPKSFKIQHAIARNYLKYANSQSSFSAAENLFETGEQLMKALIQSREYYIQKAKPFSISCYVLEKVRYIRRFSVKVTVKELCELRDMLKSVYRPEDVYIIKAMQEYYKLLEILGKQNLVQITFGSPYYDILRKTVSDRETEDHANMFLQNVLKLING